VNINDCKWVFKIKKKSDGSKRYKECLIAKRFKQLYGLDYEDTFSPVVKLTTTELEFISSTADMSLFNIRHSYVTIYLLVYVDNIIDVSSSTTVDDRLVH
jgi:hypothetical protein